ncbi:hypothetical protein HC031_30905 [Planosporangium thailandense]|uniref:Uncharacterized protein n=1 Tax=Planosporangium thailandense TaxID=765197 RepID=A0ABX0Y6Q6_9ACTN|nr:hypothetical protein [Planosporangium thailandense]NJC74091.1 hypothetical protein [Planosporangium thailandense]
MVTVTPLREHYFGPADLPTLRTPAAGLIVGGDVGDQSGAVWAGAGHRLRLWWLPAVTDLRADAAVRLRDRPGVQTITVHDGRPDRLALAAAFSAHLAAVRSRRHLPGVWITATDRPQLADGTLRLPHLVAVVAGVDQVRDVVVWELIRTTDAVRWLGAPVPDLPVEDHLPALLRLRAAHREGRFPDTPAARQLAALLDRRYLSIRLVYQHPDLFTQLLTEDLP